MKKIFLFLLPLLFAIAFISCQKEAPQTPEQPPAGPTLTGQSTIPDGPLTLEDLDTTPWNGSASSNEEIADEAPADGITISKLQLISIGPGADCSTEMTAN